MSFSARKIISRAESIFTSRLERSNYQTAVNRKAPERTEYSLPRSLKYGSGAGQKRSSGVLESSKELLCLLIPAFNEELVLEKTIRSAISAGMSRRDIYVVDDYSSDTTSDVARKILPRANVITVQRSGKGLAINKAVKKFALTDRYQWVHIADADGAFAPDYFEVFTSKLDNTHAAATGYIRSLPGKRVSEYRVYEYTLGMDLHRRIQNLLGVISVIPGPTSCFRSDVLKKLDFSSKSLTEDFDVTLQIHRQKLGKIQFIPGAVAYTQDPPTVKAFIKQITRWNRGVMQSVVRHKIGKKASVIDAYLMYQLGQGVLLFLNTFVWVPYMMLTGGRNGGAFLATVFIMDVLLTYMITLFTAMRSKRWEVLSAFPVVYALKWVSLGVFIKAFVEVMILGKFRLAEGKWGDNETGRRYQIARA